MKLKKENSKYTKLVILKEEEKNAAKKLTN